MPTSGKEKSPPLYSNSHVDAQIIDSKDARSFMQPPRVDSSNMVKYTILRDVSDLVQDEASWTWKTKGTFEFSFRVRSRLVMRTLIPSIYAIESASRSFRSCQVHLSTNISWQLELSNHSAIGVALPLDIGI